MTQTATAKKRKRKPNFYLTWKKIKPPPGADPDSSWLRCSAGCKKCGYMTASDVMVGQHTKLKIEEQVLGILMHSALPIYCMDYTAHLIAYAHRGPKRKAIANRISAACIPQMALLDQMKRDKDDDDQKPRRSRPGKAAEDGKNGKPRRGASDQARPRKAKGGPGKGVRKRKRRDAARPADADRPVEEGAGVRDPLEKRPRKTDADGD